MASALAVLALAGCSGGGDDKAAPTTTSPAAGPSTTLRPVDTSFTGQGSGQFCNLARTYNDRFTSVAPNATPAQLRTVAREGQTAIRQAQEVAPAEISGDVQTIATTFSELLADLERANFDTTKLTPATFTRLQAPEFQRSSQRFQAYLRDVCKVSS